MQYFCDVENREAKEVVPGVRLRTFWGKEMLLSVAELDPNVVMPIHSHPHEQAVTVLAGEFELTVAGQTRLVKPGDMVIIPGGVEHGVKTGDAPSRVLDVFSPVREDYQF
jgi:quercetin dioxygenase-like cupin family protein